MTKTTAQLDAEIAEALRAKKWQEQVAREDQERRERIEPRNGPSPAQLYDERAADVAAGVFHGEQRGRVGDFRRSTPALAPHLTKAEQTTMLWHRDDWPPGASKPIKYT